MMILSVWFVVTTEIMMMIMIIMVLWLLRMIIVVLWWWLRSDLRIVRHSRGSVATSKSNHPPWPGQRHHNFHQNVHQNLHQHHNFRRNLHHHHNRHNNHNHMATQLDQANVIIIVIYKVLDWVFTQGWVYYHQSADKVHSQSDFLPDIASSRCSRCNKWESTAKYCKILTLILVLQDGGSLIGSTTM